MSHISTYWIGIRGSDLHGIEHLFDGVVALIGHNANSNIPFYSLEKDKGVRVNHNHPECNDLIEKYYSETIKEILKNNQNSHFFYQDQLNYFHGTKAPQNTIFNNDLKLLKALKDKSLCRQLMSRYIKTVGSVLLFKAEINFNALREIFPNSSRFVVQEPVGGGGLGTVLLSSEEDEFFLNNLPNSHLVVSVYQEKTLPVNQHIVIYPNKIVVLPSSAQIVSKDQNNCLTYQGCDFQTLNDFPKPCRDQLHETGEKIGKILRKNGYRGVVGIDYLMNEDQLQFVELNPRFQYSTSSLNMKLLKQGYPSLQEMHISAFKNARAPQLSFLEGLTGSSIIVSRSKVEPNWKELQEGRQVLNSPDKRDTDFSKDKIEIDIYLDGATSQSQLEDGASLGRIDTDRQVLSFQSDIGVSKDPSLMRFGKQGDCYIADALQGDLKALAKLKFHLFTYGVQVCPSAINKLEQERNCLTIRDGIAGGLEIRLPHNVHVNVPIKEYFALISPYRLNWDAQKNIYIIQDTNNDCLPVDILPIPDFVNKKTTNGTLMVDVGQMFNERLSIEVFFGCINNKERNTACHFCELGAESEQKYSDMDDIQQLVEYCEQSDTINMRHILIGGGTPPEKNWALYFDAVKAVKSATDKSIYMMIAPPNRLENLKVLHELGVAEVGMNLEVFDRKIARKIMPAKGKLSLKKYLEAMKYAVNLWGNKGAIRSILIVGLEPLDSTLKGVRTLCEIGVMPILSPYRPIPNTPLSHFPSPTAEQLFEAWEQSQKIAEEYGLTLGPHCIACQNNTITMPHGDEYQYY